MNKCIVFICTGNTCRSPMAAVMFAKMLEQKGYVNIQVESAGIATEGGDGASSGAITAMAEIGLDLSQHQSKAATVALLEQADLIITMGKRHKEQLVTLLPQIAAKIYTLGEIAETDQDVLDPYGQDDDVYRDCRHQIAQGLEVLMEKL